MSSVENGSPTDARRRFLRQSAALGPGSAIAALPAAGGAQPAPLKVLRYAFEVGETGFDPAQISDAISREVIGHIFEPPLRYDYLARPARIKPLTLAAMPEVSSDFRTFTFRLQRGIFFADDPAFNGKRRELVAADYVYAIKRMADPRWKSPIWPGLAENEILGLAALREQAVDGKRPFDYDREIDGLRSLDTYTFQIRLAQPSPRFIYSFTAAGVFGAVAREVVERYGEKIMEHPVGTGPFRLTEWRRSSRIVLERNPDYREVLYNEEAPADDPRSQAIAARFKGRRLPMIDRVEISVIEESQPRWLAFLNGQTDFIQGLPPDFITTIIPNNQLAPNLVKRGIQMDRVPLVDIVVTFFNMEDPTLGGYTPAQVALRRAISLGYNLDQELRLIRKNQMIPAYSPAAPLTYGYDPAYVADAFRYAPAQAKALLDTFGFVDRDNDGWRERPDGSPLELEYHTQSDALSRQYTELWKKSMDALGIRMKIEYGKWPEQLRASRAGKLMMWGVAWLATVPDAETFFSLGHGPQKGTANRARFDLPAYNALYDRQKVLPDGPERLALMHEMKRYFAAYMPYRLHGHRIRTDLTHAWVQGYRRHPFMRHFWPYIDIDPDVRTRALG